MRSAACKRTEGEIVRTSGFYRVGSLDTWPVHGTNTAHLDPDLQPKAQFVVGVVQPGDLRARKCNQIAVAAYPKSFFVVAPRAAMVTDSERRLQNNRSA
jgi:hypothetical protein